MNKRIRRITLTLAFVLGALISLCISASATEYYGRSALAEMENADALLYAYDNIVSGVENSLAEIEVYNGTDSISQDEIKTVIDAYRRDHAEHFWLDNTYGVAGSAQTVKKIMPDYIYSGSELSAKRTEFEAAVDEMLSALTEDMSEFEKELYLHDRLAEQVVYIEDINAHNAYGALVEGRAVCEGYAEAFQYLLQRTGIQSFLALGYSVNPSTQTTEPHGWNIVRIDGKYYHTDLTWNDQSAHTYHAYFNLTDTAILADHALDPTAYPLPVCNSTDAQYFNVVGGIISEYSVGQIATLLRDNDLAVGVYIEGSKDSFLAWLSDNINAIGQQTGVEGILSYGYSTLDKEVYICVITCAHENLTQVLPVAATCTMGGNIGYYTCQCGSWFADSDATRMISNQSAVYTAALGHDYSESCTDSSHLKENGNCQIPIVYWYDCSRCDSNAKNDPRAKNSYYTSEKYGDHDISDTLSFDGSAHFYACVIDGCGEVFEKTAHIFDNDCDNSCSICTYTRDVAGHNDSNADGICDTCGYGNMQTPDRPADTSDSKVTEPQKSDKTDKSEKNENENTVQISLSGCGGTIGATAVIFSALLMLGTATLKKKDE